MSILKWFVSTVERINWIMYWIVGIIIFAATGVCFIDVILRYLFNTVTPFGNDATLWMTLMIALLGAGYITMVREHITVDIMYIKMGQGCKRIVRYFSYLIGIFIALVLIAYGMERTLYYLDRGTKSIGGMQLHLWVKWCIVPVSGLLLLLQLICELIKEIYYQVTGEALVPLSPKLLAELGVSEEPKDEEGK